MKQPVLNFFFKYVWTFLLSFLSVSRIIKVKLRYTTCRDKE